ncbi:unnamed protein product, partial [Strongylus vulgaris]
MPYCNFFDDADTYNPLPLDPPYFIPNHLITVNIFTDNQGFAFVELVKNDWMVIVIASEMDNLAVNHPETSTVELSQPLNADLDVPPGFESTIPGASASTKPEPDQHRRGRGRGGRPH